MYYKHNLVLVLEIGPQEPGGLSPILFVSSVPTQEWPGKGDRIALVSER